MAQARIIGINDDMVSAGLVSYEGNVDEGYYTGNHLLLRILARVFFVIVAIPVVILADVYFGARPHKNYIVWAVCVLLGVLAMVMELRLKKLFEGSNSQK